MRIAFSPCPNDTYIFHAWVHGLVPGAPIPEVDYADIDVTNRWAIDGSDVQRDMLKISYAALPWVLSEYKLLPCGGALGRGCGPLVLTAGAVGGYAKDAQANSAHSAGAASEAGRSVNDPEQLSKATIAVPSERSTAYLLFRLWAAQNIPGGVGRIVVMPFHEIMPAVRDGRIDAGLVIHEARFTYHHYGLNMLVDLGEWWEQDTGLPIPLGAIIARRTLDTEAISGWIRSSLAYARRHPQASHDYVMSLAQEMDPEVAKSHIELYVNDFSADLGEEGYGAIESLLGRAAAEGIVPEVRPEQLR